MSRPARPLVRPAATSPSRPPSFRLHAEGMPDSAGLERAAWLAIAVFAAAALAMVFGPHTVGDVFTETDFYGSYGPGAKRLLAGQIDVARYGVVGPLFEMLLAAVGLVVRDLFLAAELIAVVSMSVALWCWHSLLARRAGRLLALVAVLFVASNAQFYRFAWSVTTDAPALALQAACLWALFGARDGAATPRRVLVAGVLAGLAFLTRYNSIALLPAGMLALALGWDETAGEPGNRTRRALVFGAGFAAPVAPWLAFSLSHGGGGHFQLHHNIAYEVFARPNGIVWDVYERDMEPQFPTLWSVIARDPMAVASRMLFNAFDHLRLDAQKLTGGALALAAAAGAWFAWREGVLWRLRGAFIAMVVLFFTLVPAFHSERYSLAVLPMWAVFAASFFASPRVALELARVPLKLLLVLAVLLPSLRLTQDFAARVINQLPVEVREAAEQVKPFVHPGEPVLARKPHFAWYAGLTPLTLPLADTLSQWGDAARRMKARWLYFSWPEAQMRPAFEWLLDSTSAAPGLTVRGATAHWPAVVYEIGPDFGQEPAWIGNDTLVAVHRARARVLTNDHNVEARVFLAMHEFAAGRHEEAQTYIDQLLKLGPRDPDVITLAAENRLQLQDPDGAAAYYDRLDALQPGTAAVRIGRGWVAAMKGDDATAAQYWAPVVSASSDPVTLQRMMITFSRVGDARHVEEAREALRGLTSLPMGTP
ncbi:MAG: glycosyltransferase family 39 protein [Candidatus Eisenbacteria bacterium]